MSRSSSCHIGAQLENFLGSRLRVRTGETGQNKEAVAREKSGGCCGEMEVRYGGDGGGCVTPTFYKNKILST
jgi:hypothetical protein